MFVSGQIDILSQMFRKLILICKITIFYCHSRQWRTKVRRRIIDFTRIICEMMILSVDDQRCNYEIFDLVNGISKYFTKEIYLTSIIGPRQANLVLIAYASSEGSGEPAHPRSLTRTSTARSYKQWVKRNLQTESHIPSPSEWLGMRS